MTGTTVALSWDWETEPLRVEFVLSDLMFDLDPRWEDWTAAETVPA